MPDLIFFWWVPLLWTDIRDSIKGCIRYLGDLIGGRIYIDIKDNKNAKCCFAIQSDLAERITSKHLVGKDGFSSPNFQLAPGSHTIHHKVHGKIYISISKDQIDVSVPYFTDIKLAKNYLNEIYTKYCSNECVTVMYTSEGSDWNFPIFRKPRTTMISRLGSKVLSVMNDVAQFKDSEIKYQKLSIPYRMGYFLHGKPGTGKSMIVELIAAKYGMNVYLVNMNSYKMSDTVLINLISKIPRNSLIVFDEFDKQLQAISRQSNSRLSFAGILSALDGPQRISEGCIIVLTSNDSFMKIDRKKYNNLVSKEDIESLFREGRVDKKFELNQSISIKNGYLYLIIPFVVFLGLLFYIFY